MSGKPASALPDIRLREAIAVFLYGNGYTDTQLRGIAIMGAGRWYCYPSHGTYTRIGNQVKVARNGEAGQVYVC